MTNPLQKLALDHWYQVLMAAGFAVFLLVAAGLLPNLPVTPSLLMALGTFFFGLGEWCSHPLQHRICGNIKISGHARIHSPTGYAYDLLGLGLIAAGLWPLLR